MGSLPPPMTRNLVTAGSALELIGGTPLVRLNRVPQSLGIECEVYAKLEMCNASGSIKDRVALRMVEAAEKRGTLKPGDTLIEPTSGNTGIGLALVGSIKGYKVIIVLPENNSAEKVATLRAFGATVVRTPSCVAVDSPESHISVARRLQHEIPNSHILNQFGNLDNPLAHELGTAEEIWEQTDGRVTALVAGAGTGGTITGIAKGLRKHNDKVKVIAADPRGSCLACPTALNSEHNGTPYKVEGIGCNFLPEVLEHKVIDKWCKVGDEESFTLARRIMAEEGLLVGGSSGAAMAALSKAATDLRLGKGDVAVVVFPDGIRNYMSRFVDDSWMEANGFKQNDAVNNL